MIVQPNEEIKREKELRQDVDMHEKSKDIRKAHATSVDHKKELENKQHPGHQPPPPADRAGNHIPENDYPTSPFSE